MAKKTEKGRRPQTREPRSTRAKTPTSALSAPMSSGPISTVTVTEAEGVEVLTRVPRGVGRVVVTIEVGANGVASAATSAATVEDARTKTLPPLAIAGGRPIP